MNLFTILTKSLVVILPFYVFIAVYLGHLTGINNIGLLFKEGLLILVFFSLIYEFFKAKKLPKFDILDYLIFSYIIYGVGITLYNGLGIDSIIYGGRYDFMFLIVSSIFRHGEQFLKTKTKDIIILFLYSGIAALVFSFLIKFRLKEEFLLEFGYINYISDWTFQGGIPIYHGLENSGIRRFQGIFDGPSAMAFFLILVSGTFLYIQKKKWEYYVFVTMIFFLWLLVLTYSRSAMLGVGTAIGILVLLNFKFLFNKIKKYLIHIIIGFTLILGIFSFIFQDQLKNIVLRTSSTTGHFDRMAIGIDRFKEKPLGAGLAESGPAYRSIYPDKLTKNDEQYYIPESWFIQVLTEGGIIFFIIFVSILITTLIKVYGVSKIYFGVLIAIIVMNIFLHTFETTYLSILTFLLIGLLIGKKYNKGANCIN